MSSYPLTNITNPGQNDILCGRGGGTNAHPGNIKFRKLVAAHKLRYLAASKSDKPGVARDVVREWRSMDPPGRFLAKVDPSKSGDDNNNNNVTYWADVGDKKAREKASQCLRERNGAANEAVAALVKTVTANGDACPEDYATLMNKAALVKAQNELTIQQQNEMMKMSVQQMQQQQNANNMSNNFNMNNNMGGGGGGGVNVDSFEPISLAQQQQSGGGFGGGNHNYQQQHQQQTEDAVIEAEIQRLLHQRQQTLMGNITSNPQGGTSSFVSGGMGGGGNNNSGGGSLSNSQRSGSGTFGGNNNMLQQPGGGGAYMGEESVLREYEQLMAKQREYNMIAGKMNMGNNNNMGSGVGMNNNNNMMMNQGMFTNNMNNNNNNMNMPQAPNNMGNMGGNNNNNNWQSGGGGSNSPNNMSNKNHNPDAAKDYMNRLRSMRQGGNGTPDQATSSGFNNHNNSYSPNSGSNNMMMNNMQQQQQLNNNNNNMQGGGGGGGVKREEFTIEEYQASLQQFLSHGGTGTRRSGRGGGMGMPELAMSQTTQMAGNLSGIYNNSNNNMNNNTLQCIQVSTNLKDGSSSSNNPNKRPYRRRQSIDDIDINIGPRGTLDGIMFNSVSSDSRPSFQSMDDMDIRGTFRSVDTMDLMSIGNSINDIIDEDIKMNPEMRKKYGRRLSNASRTKGLPDTINDFLVNRMGGDQTIEIKTMDHGNGNGGGGAKKKKTKKSIDPRLLAPPQAVGTRHSVQTKGNDGPSNPGMGGRGSQLSMNMNFDGLDDDSRMSFGNM